MNKVFVLEDNWNRIEQFQGLFASIDFDHAYATNIVDAQSMYIQEDADYVFLDHDLGGRVYVDSDEENTGYQFVKWIVENDPKMNERKFVVHSFNPMGAERMLKCLVDAGADVRYIAFNIWHLRDWIIDDAS